jgi:hypothetical protein
VLDVDPDVAGGTTVWELLLSEDERLVAQRVVLGL